VRLLPSRELRASFVLMRERTAFHVPPNGGIQIGFGDA